MTENKSKHRVASMGLCPDTGQMIEPVLYGPTAEWHCFYAEVKITQPATAHVFD
jgi:hypothetical protein